MLPEILFIYILLIHWLTDFGLQTDWQAKNKSTSLLPLIYHTGVYSTVWLLASYIVLVDFGSAIIFAVITFIAHTATDYFTSRLGAPFWAKSNHHEGFVIIGADQILHYIQLYLTFKLLI